MIDSIACLIECADGRSLAQNFFFFWGGGKLHSIRDVF